jgi:1,4-alpha-glucan branching enzyme
MGWMHDTLAFFGRDPVHRAHHHDELTFSLVYAFTENFVLPLSHDEVVHGKGSLLQKMPGDRPRQLANLRALLAYMWAHPGKQLLFAGGELAQEHEWRYEHSLDWHLLDDPAHAGVQALVRDLNRVYRATEALWTRDFDPEGFRWIEPNDAQANVVAFARQGRLPASVLVCAMNLSGVPREEYRVGLPLAGGWTEALNTDDPRYGGGGMTNGGGVTAEAVPWHGQPHSAALRLPPLSVVWLRRAGPGAR